MLGGASKGLFPSQSLALSIYDRASTNSTTRGGFGCEATTDPEGKYEEAVKEVSFRREVRDLLATRRSEKPPQDAAARLALAIRSGVWPNQAEAAVLKTVSCGFSEATHRPTDLLSRGRVTAARR